MTREAKTRFEVHELIRRRWSPYALDPDRSINAAELESLFEAAAWAASSFNEQPWRFIVARKEQSGEFSRMLACLMEANQVWARNASALVLGLTRDAFTRNGKPNRVALHDLGLAAGSLTLEATYRGMVVHQMAGIEAQKIVETYGVPAGFTPQTAIAIGYPADPSILPEELRGRDTGERTRKELGEFVFVEKWENPMG